MKEKRINDFGEVIFGARKHMFIKNSDVLKEISMEEKRQLKKKNFYDPNWNELKEKGLDIEAIYLRKSVYDKIHQPKFTVLSNIDKDIELYIEYINIFKESLELINTKEDIFNQTGYKKYNELIRKHLMNPEIDRKINQCEFFSCVPSRTLRTTLYKVENDVVNKMFMITREEAATRSTKAMMITRMKDLGDFIEVMLKSLSNNNQIYLKVNKKYSLTVVDIEAKYIVFNEKTFKFILVKTEDDIIDAKNKVIKESIGYFKESTKKTMVRKKTPYTSICLKEIKREGPSYHDKNINGEDYLNIFNFRGGQFGNWLNDDERQNTLNSCFDAFCDLSDVLNVYPNKLSLRGDLGIAFGSRGKGRALGHYEPLNRVINLTKMKGAGILSHEWAHAFDHAIGKALGFDGLISDQFMLQTVCKPMNDVVCAMKYNDEGFSNYYKESLKFETSYTGYWSTNSEMFARAFACYAYDKLKEMDRRCDYLNGQAYGNAPTLKKKMDSEKEAVYKAIENLINYAKEINVI